MKKKPANTAQDEPAQNVDAAKGPLLLKDCRLQREYSVMEIATLAAGCRGDTYKDRIKDAVGLLSQVEIYARLGKDITSQVLSRKEDDSRENRGNKPVLSAQSFQRCLDIFLEIRSRVLRDAATGKMRRTSLVALCCEKMKAYKGNLTHANRLYSQWLAYEAWLQEEDVEKTKATYESGTKPAVIHSDQMAGVLATGFLKWLETRPKRPPATIIQSQKEGTKGQIVSPKDRGAERADESVTGTSKKGNKRKPGQFTTKPKTATEEHAVPRRNSRTRMDGNRPN